MSLTTLTPQPASTVTTAPAARAVSLTKLYGAGDATVAALDDVSVALDRGRFTAIMGPSGSGKSTLLHVLAGLDRPTSGKVYLGDTEITSLRDNRLTKLRRDRIGFIFQLHHLLPQCTALENVLLPTLAMRPARAMGGAGGAREPSDDRARRLLDRYEELWQGRIERMAELVAETKEEER